MMSSPAKVFISHAEHDKGTIAIPLYERLKTSNMQPFVDEDLKAGDDETAALEVAMDEADIAVIILSPEYIAYKQPMKQLLRFLQRRRDAFKAGVKAPLILPCFYRLSKRELHDEPRLDRWESESESKREKISLYGVTRFLERMSNGEPEANIATIKAALSEVGNFTGLENDVEATNHDSIAMYRKRRILIEQLCRKVINIEPDKETETDTPSSAASGRFDEFIPYFESRFDVSGLVLNFTRTNEHKITPELELLRVVLDKSPTEGRSIAVKGIAGVGKTSMVKGLLKHSDISSRFKDGIYFMHLGNAMTQRELVELLASIVRCSGGVRRAALMLEMGTTVHALEQFRSWFSMKDCLFVVDDIWETEEMSSSLIHNVLTLCRNGPKDKVLLTTRSRDVASRADVCFIVEPKESQEAREILFRYSCIPIRASTGGAQHKAVVNILSKCCGLPLFLAIAGRAVRSLSFVRGAGVDRAYQMYGSILEENLESLVNTSVDSYERLRAKLILSIEMLQDRMSQLGFNVPLPANEMHKRLSVLERQERVPMIMLQYLWELNSEAQVEIVAREFEQMAVVNIEIKETGDGGYRQILYLHDSLHLFATCEARNEIEKVHDALLKGYGRDLAVVNGHRMWWCARLKPDGYIHENLCRHLLGSARYDEIIQLMFNPEWIARMLAVSGISRIERDFSACIAALESEQKKSTNASTYFDVGLPNRNSFSVERRTIKAMQLLSAAVSAAAKYILANFQEFSFQLWARLVGHSVKFKEIHAFLDLIEKNYKGPWVKSFSCVLQNPSEMSKSVVALEASVFCMVVLGDGERIACGCQDGRITIVNVAKGATESSWKGHNNIVGKLATDRNGTIVVSGSLDFRVNVWDVKRCSRLFTMNIPNIFESFTFVPIIAFMAVLEEDRKIIVGFHYTQAWIEWRTDTGAIVKHNLEEDDAKRFELPVAFTQEGKHFLAEANPESNDLAHRWNMLRTTTAATATTDKSCIFLPDETKVVTGSMDGTARIWDITQHTQVGQPFVEPRKAWIRRLAISADGQKLAATCGIIRQVIRVWDVTTRREMCHPMSDHESEITGISFLRGGDCLVTCSKDATVRVWDITAANDDIVDRRHMDIVRHVCFTPDRSHVVSASNDMTLRVWNCSSGRQVGEAIEGHSEAVVDVAVEQNGLRIVSLSESMTVRIWNFQTRSLIREIEVDMLHRGRLLSDLEDNGDSFAAGEEHELDDTSARGDSISSDPYGRQPEEFESISTVVPESEAENEARADEESLVTNLSTYISFPRTNGARNAYHDVVTALSSAWVRPRLNLGSNSSTGRRAAARRTRRSGKGVWSREAYLSVDGRKMIRAGRKISVTNLSTGEVRLVENSADMPREGVLKAAGELTTSMPDNLLIMKGSKSIRLRNGEVLATFEAPVWHAAWAGSGNMFCVGLENGRVGIMKLMNAADMGGSA